MPSAAPQITHFKYTRDGQQHNFVSMIPPEYLLGIGAIMTNWGLFEMIFDNFLAMLRWYPAAAALYPQQLPGAFWRRAKALRQTAAVALPSCPVILARLTDITTEAVALGKKRNDVTHSHWLAHGEMIIYTGIDGTKPRYVVIPSDLFRLAELIDGVRNRLSLLQMSYLSGGDASLPLPERHAWRDLIENNRPSSPPPTHPAPLPPPKPFLP